MDYGNSSIDADSVIDTIWAMRTQEEKSYAVNNYLHQQCFSQEASLVDSPADSDCRFRMAEWSYQIIDFCKFKRETVAVAMSCLDRFLASPAGYEICRDRNMFQLASMTALYTSIKIHEPEAMDPEVMAGLSRGAFTKQQVEEMEVKMLNAIQWRVNPPTSLAFLNHFLTLIPCEMVNEQEKTTAIELSQFQTEIAVSDPMLIGVNASTIALAALLNSFDSMNVGPHRLFHIQSALSNVSKIGTQTFLFNDVRMRLFEAISGDSTNHSSNLVPRFNHHNFCTKTMSKIQDPTQPISPRSVSVAM